MKGGLYQVCDAHPSTTAFTLGFYLSETLAHTRQHLDSRHGFLGDTMGAKETPIDVSNDEKGLPHEKSPKRRKKFLRLGLFTTLIALIITLGMSERGSWRRRHLDDSLVVTLCVHCLSSAVA